MRKKCEFLGPDFEVKPHNFVPKTPQWMSESLKVYFGVINTVYTTFKLKNFNKMTQKLWQKMVGNAFKLGKNWLEVLVLA